MKVLEIDVGNTSIKWRTLDALGGVVDRGISDTEVNFLRSKISDVNHIRLACVGSSNIQEIINLEYPSKSLFVAQSTARCGQVINGYDDYRQLGVDRWLAVVAAYHYYQDKNKDLCVIDCGTAITIDYVSKLGQYQGGYILPGRSLMRKAINVNTSKINLDTDSESLSNVISSTIPQNTHDAVTHGCDIIVKYGLNALVESLLLKDIELIWTGGDAKYLHQGVSCEKNFHSDLVLDGLSFLDNRKNDDC